MESSIGAETLRLPQGLLALLEGVPEFRSLADAVRKRHDAVFVHGLAGGAPAFVMAGLLRGARRAALWVTPDLARAERAASELDVWAPDLRVAVLPPMEVLPYEVVASSDEVVVQRMAVLGRLLAGDLDVVVAPAAALSNRTVPAGVLRRLVLTLDWQTRLEPADVARRLVALGYERAELVERPGDYAVRGGILDVFPPTDTHPLRIEWFGDEIDSIRRFDATTQRTVANVERAFIGPAREPVLDDDARRRAVDAVRREAGVVEARLRGQNAEAAGRLAQQVRQVLDALETGRPFPGMEWYTAYAYPDAPTLAGVMPRDAVCIVDEAPRVDEALAQRQAAQQDQFAGYLTAGYLLPGHGEAYADPPRIHADLAGLQRVYLLPLPRRLPDVQPRSIVSFHSRTVPGFRAQWDLLADELRAWQNGRRRVVIGLPGRERAERLRELLRERGVEVPATRGPEAAPEPGQVAALDLPVREGFELDGAGLVVLSDADVAGRPVRRRRRVTAPEGARVRDYTELAEGDYVVHVHHGIGRYLGLRTMEVQGTRRDYLVLQYHGGDRVYVPTDQVDMVQKYVGGEGSEPRLSRLGGAEWNRVKERVKKSVRQMAEQLLALYAARRTIRGHAFSPDGPWQREFEEAFPYEETEDQLRAAAEIKRDMEEPRPMDRLLCGDVGYGKTEVAMRAAFKAVADGKQVAVLVPTTILAQQHYRTFKERFKDFPVTVDVLSRFRTPRQQQETIARLRRGAVDIVVGTHRLVSADVGFKDLGLLIIDEEHRFGVAQKERLKQLKQNVDVLSMTATPIPRTLHMALTGLRDMSVIETPPEDRYPVQTYVVEYNPAVIRDAILRELARGGQVFYVHNRVRSIRIIEDRLRRLVPDARIAVAHGQMDEDRLERIMLDFLDGAHDILLCTTIIESGLDIANVNTLIVEDADKMGLAQLYQLRGRVGRSNRVAYAYFTYQRDRVLTEVAEKRLQALKDFTDLGSGFKLALRDMEIRGAGNILGPEQHGFIASVGFDLYAQLLEEAVRELRGERAEPRLRPNVDLRWDAFLPDDYIRDARLKVEVYKRIDRAATREDLAEIRDELIDRFGDPPVPVWNLMLTADVRRMAAEMGVVSITQQGATLHCELVALPRAALERAGLGDRRRGRQLTFHQQRPAVRIRLADEGRDALREALNALFADLRRVHRLLGGNGRMKEEGSAKN